MSKPGKHVLIAASLVGAFACTPASATCSAEPMLGSICIVAYNFCPRGYADRRRADPVDRAEHGAVLAARHPVWRQRPDHFRTARPARSRAGRRWPGAGPEPDRRGPTGGAGNCHAVGRADASAHAQRAVEGHRVQRQHRQPRRRRAGQAAALQHLQQRRGRCGDGRIGADHRYGRRRPAGERARPVPGPALLHRDEGIYPSRN